MWRFKLVEMWMNRDTVGGGSLFEFSLDGIFFSSCLCIMHIKVIFISAALLCLQRQPGKKGNTILLLFYKRHLRSESEFAFSFSPSAVFVLFRYVSRRARSHENTYYITPKKKRKLVVLIRKNGLWRLYATRIFGVHIIRSFRVHMIRNLLACIWYAVFAYIWYASTPQP